MKNLVFLFLFLSTGILKAQQINWLGVEEAFAKQKEVAKPIILDVYTDWCGWCKRMDATTYRDPQIINYINANFYPVKFNAETNDTVFYGLDTLINPNPDARQSAHQFTANMGIRSYPTTVFFDKKGSNPTIASGALQAEEMAPLLIFFAEDLGSIIDVNTFSKDFKRTFNPDSTQLSKGEKIKWKEFNEGIALAQKTKKKIWIQNYTQDCATCKMLDSTVYQNTFIANYLNENYIPIKFNAFSKDTITIQGKKFGPSSTNPNSYHQLILGSLQNQPMNIPSVLIFDENEQLLAPVPSYLNLKYAEALAVYFFENKNLQQVSFSEFITSHTFKSVSSN